MTTTRTHFTFRVDTWTPEGESIVEHVAGVEDYQVALATFLAACQRWPGTPITLRLRCASDRGQPAPARGVQSVRAPLAFRNACLTGCSCPTSERNIRRARVFLLMEPSQPFGEGSRDPARPPFTNAARSGGVLVCERNPPKSSWRRNAAIGQKGLPVIVWNLRL